MELTELIPYVAGIVLSLLFSYVPKLNAKFEALEGDMKRLIMLGALLVTSAGILGVSCIGWYDIVACDQSGIKSLVEAFVAAAIANQATYMLTPKGKSETFA